MVRHCLPPGFRHLLPNARCQEPQCQPPHQWRRFAVWSLWRSRSQQGCWQECSHQIIGRLSLSVIFKKRSIFVGHVKSCYVNTMCLICEMGGLMYGTLSSALFLLITRWTNLCIATILFEEKKGETKIMPVRYSETCLPRLPWAANQ